MKDIFIKDITGGCTGTTDFMVTGFSEKLTKSNKKYFDLVLTDNSGSVPAKVWNVIPNTPRLVVGDFVRVTYSAEMYQNSLQISITSFNRLDPSTVNLDDFCPVTKYSIEKMWSLMINMLNGVQNLWLTALIDSIIGEDDFKEQFCRHSAATKIHHAYKGGLLQHTLFVMRCGHSLAKIYELDSDLVVTCAFLHDIGKLIELSAFPKNDYTVEGQLVGHVVLSTMYVSEKINAIDGFPDELKQNVLHCIVSHHGKLEYGSPKVPSIKEALILHFADSIDSRIEIAQEDLESNSGSYNRYLETYVMPTTRPSGGEIDGV